MATYELWENVTGRTAVTDEQGGQEVSREWEATVDEVVTGPDVVTALAVLGVAKGDAHPTYAYARCTRIVADPVPADPHRWVVRADYKEPAPQPGQPINPGGGGAGGGQPSPPDRPAFVRGTFRRQEVFRTKDAEGTFYANSAGDLLEDAPPTFEAIGIITVSRYYDDGATTFGALFGLLNKVNGATWQGFPKHSLLVTGVDWEPMTERGWVGQKVTFTLEFREKQPEQPATATGGWRPTMVLDRGWRVLEGGELVAIADKLGQTRSAPALLDGAGAEKTDSADPTFLPFVQFGEANFAEIAPAS